MAIEPTHYYLFYSWSLISHSHANTNTSVNVLTASFFTCEYHFDAIFLSNRHELEKLLLISLGLMTLFLEIHCPRKAPTPCNINMDVRSTILLQHSNAALLTERITKVGAILVSEGSFVRGSRLNTKPRLPKFTANSRGSSGVYASRWMNSLVASNVFTLGPVAVLPFYTLMVVAPKAELTKKSMQSSIPYFVVGVLYTYLLYLSWTPEMMQLMFASKSWLLELPGIARIFSNEITLASAWIHLLAVDLFATRQVFHDGLENGIETRHSVSFCLLFFPVGIFTHFITKAFATSATN